MDTTTAAQKAHSRAAAIKAAYERGIHGEPQ